METRINARNIFFPKSKMAAKLLNDVENKKKKFSCNIHIFVDFLQNFE